MCKPIMWRTSEHIIATHTRTPLTGDSQAHLEITEFQPLKLYEYANMSFVATANNKND